MKRLTTIVLVVSDLALLYACSMRLINPAQAVFLQGYWENNAAMDVSLASEVRGVGAVMLLAPICTFLGALRPSFRQSSFIVLTVVFGGVVVGRLVSLPLDGIPNPDVLRALAAEVVLSLANLFVWRRQ